MCVGVGYSVSPEVLRLCNSIYVSDSVLGFNIQIQVTVTFVHIHKVPPSSLSRACRVGYSPVSTEVLRLCVCYRLSPPTPSEMMYCQEAWLRQVAKMRAPPGVVFLSHRGSVAPSTCSHRHLTPLTLCLQPQTPYTSNSVLAASSTDVCLDPSTVFHLFPNNL